MKVTDLKGKDSFYTAERALEEIRTGLQEDVGNAMSKAYTQVLETDNKENRSQDSSMDRQRQSDFQDRFIKELMRTLRASQTTDDIYSLDYLRGYVDLEYDDSKVIVDHHEPDRNFPCDEGSKKCRQKHGR